jgi:hypothetical protein
MTDLDEPQRVMATQLTSRKGVTQRCLTDRAREPSHKNQRQANFGRTAGNLPRAVLAPRYLAAWFESWAARGFVTAVEVRGRARRR